jgi:flagellar biosynthesis/type III secretory pathway ATPase
MKKQQKWSCEKTVKDLLNKYEKKVDNLIVMDDYDGGQKSILDSVVADLESLDMYIEMEKYPHQDNHMD